jgi:hypothetical protein
VTHTGIEVGSDTLPLRIKIWLLPSLKNTLPALQLQSDLKMRDNQVAICGGFKKQREFAPHTSQICADAELLRRDHLDGIILLTQNP